MTPEQLSAFREILGEGHLLTGAETAPFDAPWRGRDYHGRSALVALPPSVPQLQAVIRLCREHRIPIVPQGGNTGLVGGSTPDAGGREIVLSTTRLRAIRQVEDANATAIVEAGCVLAEAKAGLAERGWLFPLGMASEGSATIGGCLATNAGGVSVLRYGMMRDLTLGVEAVLPDGSLFSDLSSLRKNNTGYGLSSLLIGSEGTLGVITAASLRLSPLPRQRVTAWAAAPDLAAALAFLAQCRRRGDAFLTAFELIGHEALDLVTGVIPDCKPPLAERHACHLLIECQAADASLPLSSLMERLLADGLEQGMLADAVLARSEAESQRLWRLRESITEAQRQAGVTINFDVSLPLERLERWLDAARRAMDAVAPQTQMLVFGHLGDGNLHVNLLERRPETGAAFLARKPEYKRALYDSVAAAGGSISAEHGIGRERKEELARYGDPVKLDLLKRIKRELDPENLFNPGRLIDVTVTARSPAPAPAL